MRFGNSKVTPEGTLSLGVDYEIERYLHHQGAKWIKQYDPNSMLYISKAMDAFTVEQNDGHGKKSLVAGLAGAKNIPSLVSGVQTDVLFPCWQQKEIADTLKGIGNSYVSYYELDSIWGHDSFLLDVHTITAAVKGHLEQEPFGTKGMWEDVQAIAADVVSTLAIRDTSLTALREVFKALDKNKDGFVEIPDLKVMCSLLWAEKVISGQDLDLIFDELRSTSEGKPVHLEQFLLVHQKMRNAPSYKGQDSDLVAWY